ncbi:MAG: hypothetical protein Q4A92_08090 [Corynebacterium sp.]|nr:hypothetical protein [Corynebacterium sp.]
MLSKLTRRTAAATTTAAAAGVLLVPTAAADDLSTTVYGSFAEFWWNFAWIPAYFSSILPINEFLTSIGF